MNFIELVCGISHLFLDFILVIQQFIFIVEVYSSLHYSGVELFL